MSDEVYKSLKRNLFFSQTTEFGPPTGKEHFQDYRDYHLPLAQMHHANLHGWGVVRGLEVSGTVGSSTITIAPGIAIDKLGRLIALSAEGSAAVGQTRPTSGSDKVSVPVSLQLQPDPETREEHTVYITIQFEEIFLPEQDGAGPRLEQVPWIRVQPTSGDGAFKQDSPGVILGIVVVDATGKLQESKVQDPDLPYGRQLVGQSVRDLRLRRSEVQNNTISETLAGQLGPGTKGGLKLSVPNSTDEIILAQESGGDFARLNVHANSLSVTGALEVGAAISGASLQVTGNILAEGNLSIKGATQLSEVGVNGSLSVAGGILTEGNLGVNGSLSVTGGIQTAGNLQVSGATQLAEARTTTLNVTGQTNLSGGLTVTGNVGVGTTKPAQELHIVTSGQKNADVRLEQEGYQYLDLFSGKESGLWSYGNRRLLFGTDAQERMCITGDGKVGIRTKTPQQTLDINGRLHISQGVIQRGGAPITSTEDLGLYSQVPGNWMRFVTNKAPFRFFTDSGVGGKAIFSIEANGVVKLEDNLCVTSGQENLRLIRGSVDPTGQIVAGAGFRVTKVGRGLYDIVFSVKYPSRPTVVATQYFAGSGNGGNTRDNCTVVSVSSTTCRLKCGNGDGEPSDRHFEFIVMGPR